uniref:MATA-HMG n=1 Tax=Rhizophagus irregularis TaxID=588596 RepID=A0A1B1EU34_9GLOM|nr:MATA-HMG [Rhizophagus irregularis]
MFPFFFIFFFILTFFFIFIFFFLYFFLFICNHANCFPPNITAQELLKYKLIPNPFIIYRIALKIECKSKNITIERKFVSNIASNLWKSEPASVKNTYKEIENRTS